MLSNAQAPLQMGPDQSPGMGLVLNMGEMEARAVTQPGSQPSWEDAEKADLGRGQGGRAELVGSEEDQSTSAMGWLRSHRAPDLTVQSGWLHLHGSAPLLPARGPCAPTRSREDLGGRLPLLQPRAACVLSGRTLFICIHAAEGPGAVTPTTTLGAEGGPERQPC